MFLAVLLLQYEINHDFKYNINYLYDSYTRVILFTRIIKSVIYTSD